MAERAEHDMAVFRNLIDAGCDADFVERFFQLHTPGKVREQISLLTSHRQKLLDTIHDAQKHLDCLDYLLYQMRKKNADK